MTERTVTTRLRAEIGQYERDMASAAMSTRAVAREMDGIDGSGPRDASLGMQGLRRDSQNADRSINTLTGRLSLLGDAIAILGPALVPIGAVAIPGLAGMATQAGVAALAVGTLIGVWQGVGDAVTAVNQASMDPTAENINAAAKALNELSPAARKAVKAIDAARPVLDGLLDAGAQEYFPGFNRGLDALLQRAPDAELVITAISDKLGDLTERTGRDLAGGDWDEVFSWASTDAVDTLDDMGVSVGNVVRGLSNLLVSIDPLSDGFSGWLVDATADFASWASTVDESQGFQEFLAYVRENGPQVADTAGALANAILQIVEAAAPLGGPVLAGVEAVADVLGAVADSDLGTPIMIGVGALSLFNRTLAVTSAVTARMGAGGLAGSIMGARGGKSAVGSFRSDLAAMSDSMVAFGSDADRTAAAAGRMRGRLVTAAKAGAGIAAVAVASTGAADSVGMTNTATLALAGSMGGPWGAAIGAGAGYILDFAKANDDAAEAAARMNTALKDQRTTFSSYGDALTAGLAPQKKVLDDLDKQISNSRTHMLKSLTPGGAKQNLDVLFGGVESSSIGKAAAAQREIKQSQEDLRFAGAELAKAMGVVDGAFDNTKISTEQMDEALQRAAPAMQALGISTDEYIKATRDSAKFADFNEQIAAYQVHADSAAGRTDVFAKSVTALGNDALTTADSAAQMSGALQALIAPALNAESATDAWHASLQKLRAELKSDAGFKGFSKAAMENRDLTRGYVETSTARLTALAQVATTTETDMAEAVSKTRGEFIQSGIDAGFSRKEIVARANAMGLTPDLVKTVFEAAGITEAEQQARGLRASYRGLPEDVRTVIAAEGVPSTLGEIGDLARQYELTPKQVKTLVSLQEAGAVTGITNVRELLRDLDKTMAEPQVGVGGVNEAILKTRGLQAAIDDLHGREISIVTTYTTQGSAGRANRDFGAGPSTSPKRKATGGLIRGPGTSTSDDVPLWGSDGEFMMRAAAVEKYGEDFMSAINSMSLSPTIGLAGGGPVKTKTMGKGKGKYEAGRNSEFEWMPAQFVGQFEKFTRAIEKATDAASRQQAVVDALTSSQSDLDSAIQSTYKSALFEGTTDGWKNPDAGPNGTLLKDIEQLNALQAAETALSGKGLDGDALKELLATGSLDKVQAMAAMTPEQLKQYEDLYNYRANLAKATSTSAQEAAYGSAVRAQTAVLEKFEKHQSRSERRLDRLEAKADHFVDRMGEAAAKGASKAAAKGKKDAR